MSKKFLLLHVVVIISCLVMTVSMAFAEVVPRISTDQLQSRLSDTDLVILDVRGSWDWTPAESKIAGAERVDPRALGQWIENYPKEKTIVLYCA